MLRCVRQRAMTMTTTAPRSHARGAERAYTNVCVAKVVEATGDSGQQEKHNMWLGGLLYSSKPRRSFRQESMDGHRGKEEEKGGEGGSG